MERKSVLLTLIIFLSTLGYSQNTESDNINIPDSVLFVPTLAVAIDMAMEHSPLLKSADIESVIKEFELKSTRKEWLDNMGIESFYKYGSIDNVNIQNIGDVNNMVTAQTTDSRYSIGVYVKMSFFSFLNQRNKTKIALQEIEQSNMQKEFVKQEIRKVVIKQYSEYLYNKELIGIKNKAFLSNKVQLQKANNDYENGNLTVYEITKVMEALTKSETEFLKAKSDFNVSYLLLLELIGIDKNGEPLNSTQINN